LVVVRVACGVPPHAASIVLPAANADR